MKKPAETPKTRTLVFTTISTPAGNCPVRLGSTESDKVLEWMDAVQAMGERQGRLYTTSALKYFVRQFYDIHSPEYKAVCAVIDSEERDGV